MPEGRIVYSHLRRPRAAACRQQPGRSRASPRRGTFPTTDASTRFTCARTPSGRTASRSRPTISIYSLRRLLDPLTASAYAYQAWYIVNAKRYSLGGSGIAPGDPVEVELNPPADAPNTVRGKLLLGKLVRIDAMRATRRQKSSRDRMYVVDIDGKERRFQAADEDDDVAADGVGTLPASAARLSRSRRARDRRPHARNSARRIRRRIFSICSASIRSRRCIRGAWKSMASPAWTRPENIVTNGAFRLVARRIRDRIRLERSDNYWDRENVRLNVDRRAVDRRPHDGVEPVHDRHGRLGHGAAGRSAARVAQERPAAQRLESGAAAHDLLFIC